MDTASYPAPVVTKSLILRELIDRELNHGAEQPTKRSRAEVRQILAEKYHFRQMELLILQRGLAFLLTNETNEAESPELTAAKITLRRGRIQKVKEDLVLLDDEASREAEADIRYIMSMQCLYNHACNKFRLLYTQYGIAFIERFYEHELASFKALANFVLPKYRLTCRFDIPCLEDAITQMRWEWRVLGQEVAREFEPVWKFAWGNDLNLE